MIFATEMLPEIRAILERNGIALDRVTNVSIQHKPGVRDGKTEITVTLLAVGAEDES